MTDVVRTLPTVAPAWTDEDEARDLEAVKHGHPRSGYYLLITDAVVYGANNAVLSIPVRSIDPQWMSTEDARAFVRHPSDTAHWEWFGRTKEGSQI